MIWVYTVHVWLLGGIASRKVKISLNRNPPPHFPLISTSTSTLIVCCLNCQEVEETGHCHQPIPVLCCCVSADHLGNSHWPCTRQVQATVAPNLSSPSCPSIAWQILGETCYMQGPGMSTGTDKGKTLTAEATHTPPPPVPRVGRSDPDPPTA